MPSRLAALASAAALLSCAAPVSKIDTTIEVVEIGRYPALADPDRFGESAAEIVAFDAASARAFVVNAQDASVDILDLSDPMDPVLAGVIDAQGLGAGINSVAVRRGIVAVAIESDPKQDPGRVAFFDVDGNLISSVAVGALPDMVVFTPNGRKLLVANEGEPNDAYDVDPLGTISIVPTAGNLAKLQDRDVTHLDFSAFDDAELDPSIRIFGPGASVAQDLEPEYVAVSADSRTAWVALQENNAFAIVDVATEEITGLVGLGYKDHGLAANGLDPSDLDGSIAIAGWPVFGMYQPDGIAAYEVGGETFIVTANEGDPRTSLGFTESVRAGELDLDVEAFPNAQELQDDARVGRLIVSTENGDVDGDGDFDGLYAFGARSFSIRAADGSIVYDSGSELERITAELLPNGFNSTNDENGSFDARSDDRGPEPEGVAIGRVAGTTYAFIGLERVGGIIVYDVSDPVRPEYVTYVVSRDFAGDAEAATAGDLAPEGLVFVSEDDSPIGAALLIVGHEVSGTTSIFRIDVVQN